MKSEGFQSQDGHGVMIFALFLLVVRVRTHEAATTVCATGGVHTLICCTHIFLHIARALCICAHFAHLHACAHARTAQGQEKVRCMRMSSLSRFLRSHVSASFCPCCSLTVTSRPFPTLTSTTSLPSFTRPKSAGQAHFRTRTEKFGHLAKSGLTTQTLMTHVTSKTGRIHLFFEA